MAIEEPKFSLALKDGAFELRDYAASVVAEVAVTGNQDEAGRRGFRLLAGYIFGGNKARQKIAMTAPVTKIPKGQTIAMTAPVTQIAGKDQGGGEWLVRFTMPASYQLADLPLPNDPAVSLHAQPPARLAVLRFSGLAGEAKVAEATRRLLAWLGSRGLVALGPSQVARYNPPWTPWFLRRNEVMVPVAPA
ncbi:heme-binding protein [Rhodobacter sp. Har01]|uniref:SOUL family heme-binding protein n=1 Tax=Rhodobacter sp. Har01 TaxID=2883999 RepID=UPI001D087171|nr:heme-binding protein [Rhodobacter sp. Har01]MCB6180150.1 heme-binding protein [Rhodobacter sp. Har01]